MKSYGVKVDMKLCVDEGVSQRNRHELLAPRPFNPAHPHSLIMLLAGLGRREDAVGHRDRLELHVQDEAK